jgi:biopolymer transport protein ExbD
MKIAAPRIRRRNLVGITPLIDVVFIMLFFFMLASSFSRWHSIDLTLAAAGAPAADVVDAITLPVRAGPEAEWHGEWLAPDDLIARLAATDPGLVLVLRPLPGTPIQDLVWLLEAVRGEARHRVSLAVEG